MHAPLHAVITRTAHIFHVHRVEISIGFLKGNFILSFAPTTYYMEYIERLFSYAQSNNYSLQKTFHTIDFPSTSLFF